MECKWIQGNVLNFNIFGPETKRKEGSTGNVWTEWLTGHSAAHQLGWFLLPRVPDRWPKAALCPGAWGPGISARTNLVQWTLSIDCGIQFYFDTLWKPSDQCDLGLNLKGCNTSSEWSVLLDERVGIWITLILESPKYMGRHCTSNFLGREIDSRGISQVVIRRVRGRTGPLCVSSQCSLCPWGHALMQRKDKQMETDGHNRFLGSIWET